MSFLTLIIWSLIAIAAGLVVFEAMQFYTRFRTSSELVLTATPFTHQQSNPTSTVLVVGDSTAVGVGSDPSESIAGRIHQSFPKANIENRGTSGFKTADVAHQLQSLEGNYDYIVIQIGANDIVRLTNLSHVEDSLNTALRLATAHSNNVLLLTSGNVGTAPMFPYPLRLIYTRRTLQVRDLFKKTADQHDVTYIDLFKPYNEDPFAEDPDTYYADDKFHPSGAGYGVWYENVKTAVH